MTRRPCGVFRFDEAGGLSSGLTSQTASAKRHDILISAALRGSPSSSALKKQPSEPTRMERAKAPPVLQFGQRLQNA
jgi:hypothetical protein